VERAFQSVLDDHLFKGTVKGWKLEQTGKHVSLLVETDRGNCTIQFPAVFQSMSIMRDAITEQLGALTDVPVKKTKARRRVSKGRGARSRRQR
jgi:hypothetical protein